MFSVLEKTIYKYDGGRTGAITRKQMTDIIKLLLRGDPHLLDLQELNELITKNLKGMLIETNTIIDAIWSRLYKHNFHCISSVIMLIHFHSIHTTESSFIVLRKSTNIMSDKPYEFVVEHGKPKTRLAFTQILCISPIKACLSIK